MELRDLVSGARDDERLSDRLGPHGPADAQADDREHEEDMPEAESKPSGVADQEHEAEEDEEYKDGDQDAASDSQHDYSPAL